MTSLSRDHDGAKNTKTHEDEKEYAHHER